MVPVLPTVTLKKSIATVYVCGLPGSMTEDDIFNLCAVHGEVVSINLQRDRLGASFGIAFVGFARQIDARYAIGDLLDLSRYWLSHGHPPLKVGLWHQKQGIAAVSNGPKNTPCGPAMAIESSV